MLHKSVAAVSDGSTAWARQEKGMRCFLLLASGVCCATFCRSLLSTWLALGPAETTVAVVVTVQHYFRRQPPRQPHRHQRRELSPSILAVYPGLSSSLPRTSSYMTATACAAATTVSTRRSVSHSQESTLRGAHQAATNAGAPCLGAFVREQSLLLRRIQSLTTQTGE